jgi:signal peptide peptidase SppA
MGLGSLLKKLPIERLRNPPPVVAVVPLSGVIGRLGGLMTRGLTLRGLASTLKRAFELDDAKAVAIIVDSPGGSPVQSALITGRIRALAVEKKLPVYAFAEDVAASGGYWLLTAGDELYANESSIVGSIGVVAGSFGFPEALQRLGVERRLYTAGTHKAALDPFSPEKPEEVEHLRAILEDTHETFRRHVRDRRAGKLKADEEVLFSGRFWTGRMALELGLIDGLGDVRTVMRARFGEKVRLRLIGDGRRWWRRRLGLPGAEVRVHELPDRLLGALEERLMWSRFGL